MAPDTARATLMRLARRMESSTDNLRTQPQPPPELPRAADHAANPFAGNWGPKTPGQAINAELARAARCKLPVTLLLVELDPLGGAPPVQRASAAEPLMEALTRRIREALRTSDVVFGWSPCRLMVVATGSGYRSGERLADSLRRAVAGQDLGDTGARTVSIGVAEPVANESSVALFRRLEDLLGDTCLQGPSRVVVDHRGNSDDFASNAGGTPLKLTWLAAYESGHPEIDHQHRELFELVNALVAATLGRQDDPERIHELLDALLAHLREHFSDEESLLERLGCERLAQQREAHAALLTRAVELREQALAGTVQPGSLVEFLCKELIAGHVLTTDRHYLPLPALPRSP